MGFIDFLLRLFGLKQKTAQPSQPQKTTFKSPPKKGPVRLERLRFRRDKWSQVKSRASTFTPSSRPFSVPQVVTHAPYRFARFSVEGDGYLDMSQDGEQSHLDDMELPSFSNPEELAEWLQIPVGQLAWLTYRFEERGVPQTAEASHYHFRWIPKRNYGCRLIEAPKPILKHVQKVILHEILDNVAVHSAAHGFVKGRSIITNAKPHCGQQVVLKFDLENFYTNIRFSRVTAIFRSLGYSREAAIWLSRLCTSRLPMQEHPPSANPETLWLYRASHLPQGAPTSPALANLAAYELDLRLSGLARSFGVRYTRYADDLTFSGSEELIGCLRIYIPLVEKIIRQSGFIVNKNKRRVIRNNQRQQVTGVVVNEHTNVSRKEFDRLKAILTNCVKYGAESQNREQLPDFKAHLQGKVAHVKQLNANKALKLESLFRQIHW